MESLNDLIKTELVKTLKRFLNELEVSFDYIEKEVLDNARNVIVDKEQFEEFIKMTYDQLNQNESNLRTIMFNSKTKSKDYDFLGEISLFHACPLKLDVFANENKNTKKSIVQYLYNIFMACQFLIIGQSGLPLEQISQQLQTYVSDVKTQLDKQSQPKVSTVEKKPRTEQSLTNIMDSIMSNKQIFNLATEIAQDLQSDKIDPMSLLSGLMSGKQDPKLQGLINNITSKLDTKIKSGEIDQNVLKSEAMNILENVKDTNLPFLPNMEN